MSPNIPCFQFTEYLEKVEFNNLIRNQYKVQFGVKYTTQNQRSKIYSELTRQAHKITPIQSVYERQLRILLRIKSKRNLVNERERMMVDGVEDEEKWLAAGIAGLQQNAFYMHRALVSNICLFLGKKTSGKSKIKPNMMNLHGRNPNYGGG